MFVTQVTAVECPLCRDWIYSRATHDCHSCSCGAISVDGGFDYLRVLWSGQMGQAHPPTRQIEVTGSRQQLFHDWTTGGQDFGWVHPAERI
jgi:hypothetical protein